MAWIDVNEVAPPKDRVIEVTSGAAWVYEDTHHPKGHAHRPNTTSRHWKFQGGVMLVLWHDGSELGGTLARTGAWIDTRSGGIMPDFRFWREYENPLAGNNGMITSSVPPFPLNQQFEGDARLCLYDDIEAAIRKQIAWSETVIARDVADGRQPLPSSIRCKAAYEQRLAQVIQDRLDAFDPYELPVDVRGTDKS